MTASSFYQAAVGRESLVLGIAAHSFVLPYRPATEWLLALSDNDPVARVVPGMLDGRSEERYFNLIYSGQVTLEQGRQLAFDAIATASGRKWWIASKLVGMAGNDDGSFFGRMLLKGIHPESMNFAAWCSAAYSLALSGMDDKERLRFTSKLMAPPAGYEEFADDGMSFEAMVGMARSMPGMSIG